jgi:hypothetical protein
VDPDGAGALIRGGGPREVFFTTEVGTTVASLRDRARKAGARAALSDAAWAGVLGLVATIAAYGFSMSQ